MAMLARLATPRTWSAPLGLLIMVLQPPGPALAAVECGDDPNYLDLSTGLGCTNWAGFNCLAGMAWHESTYPDQGPSPRLPVSPVLQRHLYTAFRPTHHRCRSHRVI